MSKPALEKPYRMRRPGFVMRTIRHGAVKIRGVVFRPDEHHRAYDGRLDGQRWLFGLYWGPPNYDRYGPDGWCYAFVALWGSQAAAHARTDAELDAAWPGADCVDGRFVWQWWHSSSSSRSGGEP